MKYNKYNNIIQVQIEIKYKVTDQLPNKIYKTMHAGQLE